MLEKTLRVPWTARRSNQPFMKEINPEYSLEGLKLKPPDLKSRLTGKDLPRSSPSRILGYPQERRHQRERDDMGLIMD